MHRFRVGEFTVDPATGGLVGPGGREQLDPKVMQVLVELARHAGEVVSRHELHEAVWPGVVVGEDAISRCIYQLRRHLKQAGGDARFGAMVETLPKRGYRLDGGVVVADAGSPGPALPDGPGAPTGATPTVRAAARRWIGAAFAVALGVALLGAWGLQRADVFWRDPLAGARVTRVTDVEGIAPGVALSRDGARLAFLAGHGGRLDAWISERAGGFRNLTRGRLSGIDTPVRPLGFSPDGSRLLVWNRIGAPGPGESIQIWAVPTAGGAPSVFLRDVAELDWSPDGRRRVHHPAAPGDPLFVTAPGERAGRQIHIAANGVHCHFPVWAPDGHIYFVQGRPPDAMDVWRIRPDGGELQQVTFHASRVSYPVFIDRHTMLYLATAQDGSGPWLHGLDTRRGVAHRVGAAGEAYTSLAASADGRHLAATRAVRRSSLWRVPIGTGVARDDDATRLPVPVAGAHSPRVGPGYLLLVSPSDGRGLVKLLPDGRATVLWRAGGARLIAGPAVDRTGRRIAFAAADGRTTRLHVIDADGSGLRTLAPQLDVTGAPAWSPDGRSLVIAAGREPDVRLYRVPTDGSPPAPLTPDYARDGTWSPDGRTLVFSGADVGPRFPLRALSADGRWRALPALELPRGARRLVFVPGRNALVVLRGPAHDRNFWQVDLDTGRERPLTAFRSGFAIGDFDIAADGRELVFDQMREESDVVRIERAAPRSGRWR